MGGGGRGGSPGPEFARLFHDNPACRTPVISNPKTIFFPNSASCAKIFSESCLSSDGQFPYPVNKFRVFPNPASRVKSRIPRNFFQTLQDQLGVYICCIHAYDKASALKGIWAYWDIVPLICSIYHVDRKTSIDLICKDTEEGRVDVMKTFGSFYVSALLVSTTTFFLCIRPYKYIQHCKSYFKNQNYIKGQLVSVLLCLDRVSQRTSS